MSVKQLASGKWQAVYYYRKDGRLHKKKKSFSTKTEAKSWEREGLIQRKTAKMYAQHKELRTIRDVVNTFRSQVRYKSLRASTKERYDKLIEHIVKYCEERHLQYISEWTRETAEQFESFAYEKFKGQHLMIMMKLLFRSEMGRDRPALSRDPFSHIQIRETRKTNPRFFTPEELKLTFDHADEWLKNALMLLLSTGMRNGELVNLKWKNVTSDTIRITDSGEWSPKTFKANRSIPINERAARCLSYFRQFNSEYVLGKKVPLNRLHNLYAKLREHTGAHDTTIHTFRKTFGSLLLQKGVPIAVISNLLGHESIKTTEQIYAGLLSSNLRDAVNRLDLNLDP